MQSSMQRRGSRIYAMLKLPRETVRWEWEGCWSRRKWTKRTSYDSTKNSAMNSHNLHHMALQNNQRTPRTSRGEPGSMVGPCTESNRREPTNPALSVYFGFVFWTIDSSPSPSTTTSYFSGFWARICPMGFCFVSQWHTTAWALDCMDN